MIFAGVDVGGTHTQVLIADGDSPIVSSTTATRSSSPGEVSESITEAIADALRQVALTPPEIGALGVCVAGQVDPLDGTVKHATNLGINSTPYPLRDSLGQRYPGKIVVENDVNAAAIALYEDRRPDPPSILTYLNFGTGIAAGTVVAGRLLRGATGIAGELGQNVVTARGDTLEELAGGKALAARAHTIGLPVDELFADPSSGDVLSVLAIAVLAAFVAYDPDEIVIGGGVSRSRGFETALRGAVSRLRTRSAMVHDFVDPERLRLSPSDAQLGARGAIHLARQQQKASGMQLVSEGGKEGT